MFRAWLFLALAWPVPSSAASRASGPALLPQVQARLHAAVDLLGPGHAVLPISDLITEKDRQGLLSAARAPFSTLELRAVEHDEGPPMDIWVFDEKKSPWRSDPVFSAAQRLAQGLEQSLAVALPGEPVALETLEVRHKGPGPVPPTRGFHTDGRGGDTGFYLRALAFLAGPGTLYREGRGVLQARRDEALVLTTRARARVTGLGATVHAEPTTEEERLLLVFDFGLREGSGR